MLIAPSGHHLQGGPKAARGKDRSSQMSTVEIRVATPSSRSSQAARSAVSWREELLLASLLLVVAGWIILRLVMVLLTQN